MNLLNLQIKFRGLSKDTHNFVYGLPKIIKNRDGTPTVFICFQNNLNHFIEIEVIPETVSEYTGLKDKNNTEIYADDILFANEAFYKVVHEKAKAVEFRLTEKSKLDFPRIPRMYFGFSSCNRVEVIDKTGKYFNSSKNQFYDIETKG